MNTQNRIVEKYPTLEEAIKACHDRPAVKVYVIESRGEFYIEFEESIIRSWERLIYQGLSNKIQKENQSWIKP